MNQIKVYLSDNKTVPVVCPQCGGVKPVDVSPYRQGDESPKMEIQCPCGFGFIALFERRKYYRKLTRLFGYCISFQSKRQIEVIVENVSRTGLGIMLLEPLQVQIDDILKISFVLDNKKRSRIEKKVIVRRIEGMRLGTEFFPPDEFDKEIGFYLMP